MTALEKAIYDLYLHLQLYQPHSNVITIWMLGNWLAFTIGCRSWGQVIVIWELFFADFCKKCPWISTDLLNDYVSHLKPCSLLSIYSDLFNNHHKNYSEIGSSSTYENHELQWEF